MTTYHNIRTYIIERIGAEVLDQILAYAHKNQPRLWGIDKAPGFLNESVCLTIYKDMTAIGYQRLLDEISFMKTLNDKSFRTNAKRIRAILEDWGREQMVLGNSKQWEDEKELMETDPDLAKVNLWIDSTDFPMEKYNGYSKKAADWSFKCNHPGARFMTLESASRKIRKIWGPYSPKTHDGTFLVEKRHFMKKRLMNAVIIGDQHFSRGNALFERPKFLTPIRRPNNRRQGAATKDPKQKRTLTQKQKEYNKQQRHLRSRVESPFGWIKENFKSLSIPWREDVEYLANVVCFAAGCFNNSLTKIDYFARV